MDQSYGLLGENMILYSLAEFNSANEYNNYATVRKRKIDGERHAVGADSKTKRVLKEDIHETRNRRTSERGKEHII